MKKTKFFISALCLCALFFTGCNSKKENVAENTVVNSLFAVNAFRTSAGNLDNYLEFGGDVASVNEVSVLPDQAGKITNVLAKVGDMVSRGQIIAYVNPMRAGTVYEDTPVRAPIAGRIISFPFTIGSTVSQSTPLATVARTDELEIRISIAERFISRIEENQNATVTFDAYPGVVFGAKVFEISPVLDTSTRSMSVKLHLNPPDKRVKVGMYGRVKLVTDSVKDAIVVPSSAIVTRDDVAYIFVIDSEKTDTKPATVRMQKITQGLEVDNKVEITEGLTVGDLIVVKGQTLLNDGSNVNIVSVSE